MKQKTENYNILLKEIKDISKWRDIPFFMDWKTLYAKWQYYPKWAIGFMHSLSKFQWHLLKKTTKLHMKSQDP
jgi:hypothetical protein